MENSTNPKQITFPGDASKPFITDKDGVVYPDEMTRSVQEFLSGEGSMGFERNQQVKRDTWAMPNMETIHMGQHQIQKLKSGGSHNI